MAAYRVAVLVIWLVFISQLALVAVYVPPWQNPDEPSHFAVIRALVKGGSPDRAPGPESTVEAEILASMARHGWWRAYGEPVPAPLPSRFSDIEAEGHLNPAMFGEPALYYTLASTYCRLIGAETVLDQYLALRIASALMSLAAFGFIIRAARTWFGDEVSLYTGALIALVPQFALMSIAVSPEPLVYLAGALVWWQAARLLTAQGGMLSVFLMVGATVIAVLAKRGAAPLVVQTGLLVALATVATKDGRRPVTRQTLGSLALVLAGALAVIVVFGRPGELSAIRAWWQVAAWDTLIEWPSHTLSFYRRFTGVLFGSAYLAGGWMRFWAPQAVLSFAGAVATFGVVRGIGVSVWSADRGLRRGAAYAALIVIVQLVAIYVYGMRFGSPTLGAQGRFLFAVIGPLAALCAIGLVRWRSRGLRIAVGGVALGLLAVLDVVCWVTVIVPAYAR